MDVVVNNLDNRGGKIKGVGDVLQGGGADSTYFWSYMWVMTPHMGRSMGGFQHRVSIQINGR